MVIKNHNSATAEHSPHMEKAQPPLLTRERRTESTGYIVVMHRRHSRPQHRDHLESDEVWQTLPPFRLSSPMDGGTLEDWPLAKGSLNQTSDNEFIPVKDYHIGAVDITRFFCLRP